MQKPAKIIISGGAVLIAALLVAGFGIYIQTPKDSVSDCGPFKITLPKEFLDLPRVPVSSKTTDLDEQGFMQDASGCSYWKMSPNSVAVIFGAIKAARPESFPSGIYDQKEFVRTGAKLLAKSPKATIEDTMVQAYPTIVLTDYPTGGVHKQYFLLHNSTVYVIDFVASDPAFEKYWPNIESAIGKVELN